VLAHAFTLTCKHQHVVSKSAAQLRLTVYPRSSKLSYSWEKLTQPTVEPCLVIAPPRIAPVQPLDGTAQHPHQCSAAGSQPPEALHTQHADRTDSVQSQWCCTVGLWCSLHTSVKKSVEVCNTTEGQHLQECRHQQLFCNAQ
jgi:hypothetical protein